MYNFAPPFIRHTFANLSTHALSLGTPSCKMVARTPLVSLTSSILAWLHGLTPQQVADSTMASKTITPIDCWPKYAQSTTADANAAAPVHKAINDATAPTSTLPTSPKAKRSSKTEERSRKNKHAPFATTGGDEAFSAQERPHDTLWTPPANTGTEPCSPARKVADNTKVTDRAPSTTKAVNLTGPPQLPIRNKGNTKPKKAHNRCRAVQLKPRYDLVSLNRPVSVDLEGVLLGAETGANKQGAGRCSIVNDRRQVIFDGFVRYPKDVPHSPPLQWLKLGVKYNDIKPENGAILITDLLAIVTKIFDIAGTVIMQMLKGLDWSRWKIRDTQRFSGFRQHARGRGGNVGLADLVARYLDRTIQSEEHFSVEDALATMELYLLKEAEIEAEYALSR